MNDLELLRENLLTIASQLFDVDMSRGELAVFIGGIDETELPKIEEFISIYWGKAWKFCYYEFANGNFKSNSEIVE
jgi:hypothetical protein